MLTPQENASPYKKNIVVPSPKPIRRVKPRMITQADLVAPVPAPVPRVSPPRVASPRVASPRVASPPPARIVATPPRLPTPPSIAARSAAKTVVAPPPFVPQVAPRYERVLSSLLNKTKVKGALKKAVRHEIIDELAELLQLAKIKEGEWEITNRLQSIALSEEIEMAKNLIDNLYNASKDLKKEEFIETLEILFKQIPENLTYVVRLK